MRNTFHARFGGRSARWMVLPAVLASAGVAWVSLATGVAAGVGITATSTSAITCRLPGRSVSCTQVPPQLRAHLNQTVPIGALPHIGRRQATTPLTPEELTKAAAVRAQLHAAMPGLNFATGK
jgi:hypothetical protein